MFPESPVDVLPYFLNLPHYQLFCAIGALATWAIGGNLLIYFNAKRVKRPYRFYESPVTVFRSFNAKEWLTLAFLGALSLSFVFLSALEM